MPSLSLFGCKNSICIISTILAFSRHNGCRKKNCVSHLNSCFLDFASEFANVVHMSFVRELETLPLSDLLGHALDCSDAEARAVLGKSRLALADYARLLSPAAGDCLEELCQRSQALTRRRFGKVIRLFAPLYLSNECVNNCKYCGFSRDNPILRVTLSVEEVLREAHALKEQGFRNILLVSGEHPKFVSNGYVADCVRALHPEFPSVSLEIAPMDTEEYRPLVAAGADGLVVYQETYDRRLYAEMHTFGPKRDFNWRLETPESPRRGLSAARHWRVVRRGRLAARGHLPWGARCLSLAPLLESAFDRLSAAFASLCRRIQPPSPIPDRAMVQVLCALRLFLPDAGLVLSTREPAKLRDGLIPLGITMISAGSHTEPGGYTGAGREKLHYTKGGRIVQGAVGSSEWAAGATGQFDIANVRSSVEVATLLQRMGYEPVWKDWDAALTA